MQLGAYRLLQQIGEGGMGSVWLAEHAMLGRRAAIKVLHASFNARPEVVARFFNEARAATAISDPGIVQVFDFGHHTDGSAYIVMELLEGEPLDKRLRRSGVLAVADALRIMRQVAGSVGAAHARGIIHRDLKPENIYLVRDPEVAGGERAKILDFGIAKLTGEHHVKTQTSAVMGTPTYMSPEQCRGAGQIDQRSDVYALGCVLFTLVTGRPPFDAEGAGDIIAMHLREPPPLPSSWNPQISPELDQAILSCLAKDPALRFATASALASTIGSIAEAAPSRRARAGVGPFAPTLSSPGTTSPRRGHASPTTLSSASGALHATPTPSKKRLGIVLGAALAVGAGGIGWVATHRGDRADAPPQPASAPAPTVTTPTPTAPARSQPAATPPAPSAAVVHAPAPGSVRDPAIVVRETIKSVLATFVTWSHAHVGAPCPHAAELDAAPDPWGKPFEVTCTDQPREQIIGVISRGPDGKLGTDDDISSWQLGNDVTALVRGEHWDRSPPKTAVVRGPHTGAYVAVKKVRAPAPAPPAAQPAQPVEPPKPAVQLDSSGFPVSR